MRTKLLMVGQHRMFRVAVWMGRAIGWALLLLAIFGIVQTKALPTIKDGFKLLPSIALALVGGAWLAGLELFLRFFDRYLSRN